MGKSVYEVNEENKEKYKTKSNTFDMFPEGTKVKIICAAQDFYFFYGETGVVSRNTGKYLGIQVQFDGPREFENGYIQESFNFEPADLVVLGKENWRYCFVSGKYGLK